MSDLSAKVAKARQAGYSDDEITAFLGKDPSLAPKITKARQAGYKPADIVKHLEGETPRSAAMKDATRRVASTPDQVRAFTKGASFGFADELDAAAAFAETGVGNALKRLTGGKPKYSAKDAYGAVMDANKADDAQFARDKPMQNVALQVAGGIMSPGGVTSGRWIAGAPSLTGKVVRSAAVGGTIGGASGFGSSDGGIKNRLEGGAKGAALGASVGAAMPAAAAGVKAAAKGFKAGTRPIPKPDIDALRTAKNAAYTAVDESGIRFSNEAFGSLVDGMESIAQKNRMNPRLHPNAAAMLDEFRAMKGSEAPSLTELDQLRQVIGRDVASLPSKGERFFGKKMIAQIDSFIDQATMDQVSAGSAGDASVLVNRARGLNTKVAKLDAVEAALEKARLQAGSTGSGGNIDNATRQQLKKVLERQNNFTPAEKAKLEQIILGTPGQNTMRQVGKLSPQGNGLMQALSIGGAVANPALALPAAAGAASKVIADRTTQRRVAELVDMIASGGNAAAEKELTAIAKRFPDLVRDNIAKRAGQATTGIAGRSQGVAPAVTVETINDEPVNNWLQRRDR